ncbi:MAG: ATP-binding cassette domain-containing protein [Bdellovibrionaceae bacterium]|nr:ATP-binding cassette domain-containing protein [Pseudobdellovibrionaceae bacterium]
MQIELSNITVNVGTENKALFSISRWTLKEGEKLLLKGASGKGKTTFLHLLAGLFSPSRGEVKVGTFSLDQMTESERTSFRRRHVGFIFQKLNLIEHLTVLENIELATQKAHDHERALSALKAVGLGGREHERVSVLSLGEQQRAAVARVLAGHSSVVFADEPTSSLDEANAHEVARLLVESCRDKTLIVVSHDQRIEKYFSSIQDFTELTR